jgi:hypothetical protein
MTERATPEVLFTAIATVLVCAFVTGCVVGNRPQAHKSAWLPTERVHPALVAKLGLRPGHWVRSCGHLIERGLMVQFNSQGEAVVDDPLEEVQDLPNEYYDNRTGRLVAACEFIQRLDKMGKPSVACPPKSWVCSS